MGLGGEYCLRWDTYLDRLKYFFFLLKRQLVSVKDLMPLNTKNFKNMCIILPNMSLYLCYRWCEVMKCMEHLENP